MNGIATLHDVEAIESQGIPIDFPGTTYELLKLTAQAHPLAPALSYFEHARDHRRPRTWNYRQLLAQVTRAANAFHGLGASKDTVIAVVLPNLPETHFAVWGAQATGISMPINYLLEPAAIADLIDAAGAEIVVTARNVPGLDLWERLQPQLVRLSKLRHVLLVEPKSSSRTASPVANAGTRNQIGSIPVHDFAGSLRKQPGKRLLSDRRIDPEDRSSYLCTGGTTGNPKIAIRRHRNEVANAWSASQCVGEAIAPGKTLFCGLPLFHANGLLVTGLLPFSRGAHVILGTPLGYRGPGVIENFWSIVEQHRVNFFSAVPTIYGALLDQPRGTHRLDSLEFGLCGAAPMPPDLIHRYESATGVKILEGYGLTEGTCVSTLNPPRGERRAGSIGLRVPGQAMKAVVLNADRSFGRDTVDGEAGMLVISGPNVFEGYFHDEDNQNIWLEPGDGRRWLVTGDLGYRDPQGYFWLTGRAKDLIIRGGHNIDPASLEQPLQAHPAVQFVAAVGRPDAHAGEVPVVYVQLVPGQAVPEADLAAFLQENLRERAAMPKAIHLIDAMPLTAIGKINKPELRRREARRVLADALVAAGVEPSEITMATDGSARIDLARDNERAVAEEVLARFPVRFVLTRNGIEPA